MNLYNQVTGYQTAQYVAGPTRNNVQQQQPKAVVATAPYNANQTYAPQTAYQQNAQANTQPKRQFKFNHTIPEIIVIRFEKNIIEFFHFHRTSSNNYI